MELLLALLPYYLCMAAGLIMVVGGIWLLAKGKIILDAKTGEVVDFDFPLLGKFKTNIPVLGLFLIGFIPLIYPIPNIPKVMSGLTASAHDRDQAQKERDNALSELDSARKQAVSAQDSAQKQLEALQKKLPRPIVIVADVTSDKYPVLIYTANKMTPLERGEKTMKLRVPVYDDLEEYNIFGRIDPWIGPIAVVDRETLQSNQNQIPLPPIHIQIGPMQGGWDSTAPLLDITEPAEGGQSRPPSTLGPIPEKYRATARAPRETSGGPP